jgi:ribosomal protein S5
MSIQEEDKIKNDEKKNEQIINLNEEVVEIMEVEKIIKKGKDKNGNINKTY